MLVLTRRRGQQVYINNGAIQVKVLKVKGNTISLGFIAPEHMNIDREEIYLKKLDEAQASVSRVAL